MLGEEEKGGLAAASPLPNPPIFLLPYLIVMLPTFVRYTRIWFCIDDRVPYNQVVKTGNRIFNMFRTIYLVNHG